MFILAAASIAFVSGLLSTVSGLGGAVVLLAMLALLLPPHQVVVFSAPVVLVGNVSRLVLFRQFVDRRLLAWFLVGGIPAAVLGGLLLPHIPVRTLEVALGVFMLGFVARSLLGREWRTPPEAPPADDDSWVVGSVSYAFVGAGAGLLSSTVGASGPFTAPFLATRGLTRQQFVGTMAGGTTALSIVKISTFAAVGLLDAEYVPALIAAGLAIIAGNVVGRRILDRTSQRAFTIVLMVVITLSGVELLIG